MAGEAKIQKHSRGCIYGLSEIWDEIIEELFRFQDKDDSNILNIKDLVSFFNTGLAASNDCAQDDKE